jgi:hypothetical protein
MTSLCQSPSLDPSDALVKVLKDGQWRWYAAKERKNEQNERQLQLISGFLLENGKVAFESVNQLYLDIREGVIGVSVSINREDMPVETCHYENPWLGTTGLGTSTERLDLHVWKITGRNYCRV